MLVKSSIHYHDAIVTILVMTSPYVSISRPDDLLKLLEDLLKAFRHPIRTIRLLLKTIRKVF